MIVIELLEFFHHLLAIDKRYEPFHRAEPKLYKQYRNGSEFPVPMTVFFYICEYLGIRPQDFFDTESKNPVKANELLEAAKGLRIIKHNAQTVF